MNNPRASIKRRFSRIGRRAMLGRMQDWPLLMHKIIDFAAIQFPRQEVVSRTI
jgi:hypothetical protein